MIYIYIYISVYIFNLIFFNISYIQIYLDSSTTLYHLINNKMTQKLTPACPKNIRNAYLRSKGFKCDVRAPLAPIQKCS